MCIYHFNMTSCGINLKFRACSSWEKPLHWVDSPSKLFGWHHFWPQILAQIDVEGKLVVIWTSGGMILEIFKNKGALNKSKISIAHD